MGDELMQSLDEVRQAHVSGDHLAATFDALVGMRPREQHLREALADRVLDV